MTETRIDFQDFHWLDVSHPTSDGLSRLAQTYGLHATSVQDCMQPEHLPKHEVIEDVGFIILRAYDLQCSSEADTVQELTRKVAVFYGEDFLLTIHRKDQPFLETMLAKWTTKKDKTSGPQSLLADLINEVVRTFEPPVMSCLRDLEIFETEIFGAGTQRRFRLSKGYYLKRKVSVFKRMLRATFEPVNRSASRAEARFQPHFQNAREHIESLFFYADEVSESINSLLNLHVSLASQRTNEASRRTNEVMRVLTIFSCFFLPVNYIASIYGMNFRILPETQWEYGYYYALGLMAIVSLGNFVWFRRKGWLGRGRQRTKSHADV
jgi:magnesium transporter